MLPMISTLVRAEHNPGDTFIGLGGQYLIERVLGPVNWLVINKFGKKAAWERHKDLIKEAGIVFYAGMPQYNNYDDWCMWYDKEMWNDIIVPWNLKIVSIAGGGGYPNAEWTPEEFSDHCMSSENTVKMLKNRDKSLVLTTVRDPHAHMLLNNIGIKNHHMPCSATFATRYCNLSADRDRDLVIIVPPAHTSMPSIYIKENKEEETRILWLEIFTALKKEHKNVLVVCHFYQEYLSLRDYIAPEELFFTSDYISLLKIYTKAKLVVSSRLHGVLPAYGIPGTKVVSIAIDTRGHATSIFPKIPLITYKDISIEAIISATRIAEPSEESDFSKWIDEYDMLIRSVDELKYFR